MTKVNQSSCSVSDYSLARLASLVGIYGDRTIRDHLLSPPPRIPDALMHYTRIRAKANSRLARLTTYGDLGSTLTGGDLHHDPLILLTD